MDQELKREIIMENYLHPYNKEKVSDDKYINVNSNNESCIDNIDLQVLLDDDKIMDIRFMGEACAISTASTSIMIKELIGKTTEEALKMIENFENMVEEEEYDKELLAEALVFDDIFKQKSRKTCATLPYVGIKKALNEYRNEKNGLYSDIPVIIFGDHTRILKYINTPFFIGADDVKILKPKINDCNYKYLYYVLCNIKGS